MVAGCRGMRESRRSAARGVAVDPRPPNPESPRPMVQRITTAEDRLRRVLGDALLTREPLRHHTTFRIGGPADFYYAARTPEMLVAALRVAREAELPVFLLGGGSNLLVSDDGFR